MDTTGALDEALQRLHTSGPERLGRLTNHAPMAVEALAAHGHGRDVHRWLDDYREKLEDFPAPREPVTSANLRSALGDPRRVADWIAYFTRETADESDRRPWREVLAEWWPRLLPGIYGGSTHPVIRVGHAVRNLRENGENGPRLTELAHGLGYWAARHHPVVGVRTQPGTAEEGGAADSLDAVRPIARRSGGFPERLARVDRLPAWGASVTDPDVARSRLAELVRAATHRYATHGHGDETMLVHAATAPNAVLRTLPALPRSLWAPSLHAAWTVAAAVTAMYPPEDEDPAPFVPPGAVSPGEVFARALAHGDEHVIKLTDTALDVGGEKAMAAAMRAIALTEPAAGGGH